MSSLVTLPVALPLLGAGLSIIAVRSRRTQRVISLATLAASAGVAIAMLVGVEREGTTVARVGGWPAEIGITFVADRLSASLLVVATSVLLIVLWYAVGHGAGAG